MEITMGGLFIALNILLNEGESLAVKHYSAKHKIGGMFFNAVICLFSTVFFILTDKNGLEFSRVFVHGLVSCGLFALGFYSMYKALQLGSFIATKMISSFSSIIAILYGICYLHEPAGLYKYIGIALVFISSVLMRYKKEEPAEKKNLSLKWFIWTLLSLLSNGFIAVVSRNQQLLFNKAYDNEFMILSLGGSFIALCILGFIYEKENFRYIAKHGILWGGIAGACNGGKNLANLLIFKYITDISSVTPIRTGIGFIITFLISLLLYKEKFTKLKYLSLVLGVIAIVLFKF